MSKPILHL